MNEQNMNEASGAPVEYAGFWIRAGAYVIDWVLLSVFLFLTYFAVSFMFYGDSFDSWPKSESEIDLRMVVLIQWVLPAAYAILFWIYRQATPGKIALRIKLADARGRGNPTTGQCIGRYLAYIPSLLFLGLGFLWVVFDERKQGWHDKLAGTVVIKKKPPPLDLPPSG